MDVVIFSNGTWMMASDFNGYVGQEPVTEAPLTRARALTRPGDVDELENGRDEFL